jgi:hypothetical protein
LRVNPSSRRPPRHLFALALLALLLLGAKAGEARKPVCDPPTALPDLPPLASRDWTVQAGQTRLELHLESKTMSLDCPHELVAKLEAIPGCSATKLAANRMLLELGHDNTFISNRLGDPLLNEGRMNQGTGILVRHFAQACAAKLPPGAPKSKNASPSRTSLLTRPPSPLPSVQLNRWPGETEFGQYFDPAWRAQATARYGHPPSIYSDLALENSDVPGLDNVRLDYGNHLLGEGLTPEQLQHVVVISLHADKVAPISKFSVFKAHAPSDTGVDLDLAQASARTQGGVPVTIDFEPVGKKLGPEAKRVTLDAIKGSLLPSDALALGIGEGLVDQSSSLYVEQGAASIRTYVQTHSNLLFLGRQNHASLKYLVEYFSSRSAVRASILEDFKKRNGTISIKRSVQSADGTWAAAPVEGRKFELSKKDIPVAAADESRDGEDLFLFSRAQRAAALGVVAPVLEYFCRLP